MTSLIIAAFCSANLVCDENNCLDYYTDFCSFEIGYRWSSAVRLHLFECIIDIVIACE